MTHKSSLSRAMDLFVCLSRFFLTLRCADILYMLGWFMCVFEWCLYRDGRWRHEARSLEDPQIYPPNVPKCTRPPELYLGPTINARPSIKSWKYKSSQGTAKDLWTDMVLVILMLTWLFQNLVCSCFKILSSSRLSASSEHWSTLRTQWTWCACPWSVQATASR